VTWAFASWTDVGELLKRHGVVTVYVKKLAPKEDNDKNQIYIAKRGRSPFAQIEQILPLEFHTRQPSTSRSKKGSDAGKPILEGRIKWNWLDGDGTPHPAPNTKAIFYLQYPEVRLSGFISGCHKAPDALRRTRLAQYGTRALAFGTGASGEVYGLVVTAQTDPALFPVAGLPVHPRNSILYFFDTKADGLPQLLEDLRRINAAGWIPSQRLAAAGKPPQPFRGTQGGGYTLEARLGIVSNASKTPDRDGIEIKSFSTEKVSLMTPTPDGGLQGESGLLAFLDVHGYPDKGDPSCRKFNGIHRYGQPNRKTGLTLTITGYDTATGFAGPEADVSVALIDQSTGIAAASWSYPRLFESWSRKHARAVYVSAKKRPADSAPHDAVYHFADTVWICEGTSSRHLLDAIMSGSVVYDPGDTSKSGKTGKPKARPQWRLTNISALHTLYRSVRKLTFP
jgi:hypothetical protein